MDGKTDLPGASQIPTFTNDDSANQKNKYISRIQFEYKPTYIRQISGLWLLVAGRDPFIEVYSI